MSPGLVARLSTIDRAVLGARIRAYRRAAQLRQSEVVDEAGVSAAYLSRIETGARRPSVAVLERIASRLEVDVGRLLVDDEDNSGDAAAAISAFAVNAAARTVAEAASRWLREPVDTLAYGELVTAVRRWERMAPGWPT